MSITPTHFRIDRTETLEGTRITTLDELREFVPDLDLTGIAADKIGEHIKDQLYANDDYGQVSEWVEKQSEVTDSWTTVTPFAHVCAGCGQPILKRGDDWIDPNYWTTCGGYPSIQGPAHAPAAQPEQTPTVPAHPLVGKTIVSVTEQRMTARDTFKDEVRWTQTTLHFTDGTTQTIESGDLPSELYDAHPLTDGCPECGSTETAPHTLGPDFIVCAKCCEIRDAA